MTANDERFQYRLIRAWSADGAVKKAKELMTAEGFDLSEWRVWHVWPAPHTGALMRVYFVHFNKVRP